VTIVTLGIDHNDTFKIQIGITIHRKQSAHRIFSVNSAAIDFGLGSKPGTPAFKLSFRDDVTESLHSFS
jgi:hypothetical protein